LIAVVSPIYVCLIAVRVAIFLDHLLLVYLKQSQDVCVNVYLLYRQGYLIFFFVFCVLCIAQRDSSCNGIMNKQEEEKAIMGVLDGSGEYKLVYEDNEGDRMLVGDVPWQ